MPLLLKPELVEVKGQRAGQIGDKEHGAGVPRMRNRFGGGVCGHGRSFASVVSVSPANVADLFGHE
jgi:hypothetical protein